MVEYGNGRVKENKTDLNFKLIIALNSLFCSLCSLKFWNSFWLEVILCFIKLTSSLKITKANFTYKPTRPPNFYFHLHKAKIYLPLANGPVFSLPRALFSVFAVPDWSSFLFIANCNNNYCVITTIHHSAVSVSRIHCLYKPSCWILKNSLFILYRLVNDFWQDLNLWWLLLDIQEKITKPNAKLFLMDDCSKCNLTETKQIEPDLPQPMWVMPWKSEKCNRKEQH